jgi:(1->4)-alpha-D-glucan 1-alpha-D-glucosylmutase
LPAILAEVASRSGSDYLAFLGDALAKLPAPSSTDQMLIVERHRDKEVVRTLLERLFNEVPFIAQTTDAVLEEINEDPDKLDGVLEKQNYRLAFWRASQEDLGYRRFFDVNTLVGLRMEDAKVFADTHALILKWLREGTLDGVRIDHPDGLRDPRQYFQQLREQAADVWIVAEKILEPGERFRSEWPIDGTTGYEYVNQVAGLFVDARNEEEFTRIYADFTGEPTNYSEVCRDKKHRVLRDLLGSDVNRLTTLFMEICEANRDRRDYTRHDVIRALREVVACFPIYRTYIVPQRDELTVEDELYIKEAVDKSKAYRPEIDPDLFDFIRDVLLLRVRGQMESEFVLRFQQFCGPVMAKGVEDTVFYCFNRLISLNEVGGDPGRFGVSPQQYHDFCTEIRNSYPRTMLALSTHDTKRSEDVRARINLLSEIPGQWRQAIESWAHSNARYKSNDLPDRNTEYFLYQTMLGAWPIDTDRLLPYMQKATREAKQQTSWLAPNEEFETATREFIQALYKDQSFLESFRSFVEPLIELGRINSLAQKLLELTAPGVPDTYQGTELWDLSLVDPDNRRPVDYKLRSDLLSELLQMKLEDVWKSRDHGLPKLWTVYHTLRTRRQHAAAFDDQSDYTAITASRAKAAHLVAYLRGDRVLVLVPRLVMQLQGEWGDTSLEIPAGRWRNQFTNEMFDGPQLRAADVLGRFPVALLVKE